MSGQTRSRVRGDRSVRKLLRQLPAAVKEEMQATLADAGRELLAEMQADVPVRTGALRAGLGTKLLKASLRLRVGIVGPPSARNRLFYGRIVEFGRKGQAVRARRAGERPYQMRVRAMAPRPFVFKRRAAIRDALNKRLRTFWNNTLADAAQGIAFE